MLCPCMRKGREKEERERERGDRKEKRKRNIIFGKFSKNLTLIIITLKYYKKKFITLAMNGLESTFD